MSNFPAPPRLHTMHVPGADPERDLIVDEQRRQGVLCLHEDPLKLGLMQNWLRTLACACKSDAGDSWSILLSDDAEPLPGWQQHLERACLNSPAPFLGLTHFGAYGQGGIDDGAPYSVGKYLLWGGAVAVHRSMRDGLLEYATRVYETTGYPHDDVLMCAYAMKVGVRVAMVNRAIFGQPPLRSMIGHHTAIRSPKTTIANTPGPSYRASIKAVKVHRNISPKGELERLAAL